MTNPARPFGRLLTLDLYGCKLGACNDIALCYDFLEQLVDELDMNVQAPPILIRTPAQYTDKAGLSGWVPLIESGIQIHTLIPKNFISVDVYSCGDFIAEGVVDLARAFFEHKAHEINLIARGLKYHEVV